MTQGKIHSIWIQEFLFTSFSMAMQGGNHGEGMFSLRTYLVITLVITRCCNFGYNKMGHMQDQMVTPTLKKRKQISLTYFGRKNR